MKNYINSILKENGSISENDSKIIIKYYGLNKAVKIMNDKNITIILYRYVNGDLLPLEADPVYYYSCSKTPYIKRKYNIISKLSMCIKKALKHA